MANGKGTKAWGQRESQGAGQELRMAQEGSGCVKGLQLQREKHILTPNAHYILLLLL